jgi:putative aminopeptidase FrvX
VVSPGANDNLTGTFIAVAALKHLHEAGTRFENTEVACLITGSEEARLRGAKAFAEAHQRELNDKDTILVAFDTLRDAEHLAVCNRDLNGTVRHDPDVCALLQEAGKNCGLSLKFESVYVGSTDATAFTQAGIRAAAIGGMDPSPPRYYHTRLDHWKNMEPDCLRRSFALVMEVIALYDRRGVKETSRSRGLSEDE